jgi:hypothetical protein
MDIYMDGCLTVGWLTSTGSSVLVLLACEFGQRSKRTSRRRRVSYSTTVVPGA